MSDEPLDRFKRIFLENPSLAQNRGRTTEADTRANVLDRLIHEVLEWPRDNVNREPFANPGYIDYQFSHGRPILLMEAKAEGESFAFPYQKQPKRHLKINGTLSSNKAVGEAITQVQRYCSDTGTRFAVVTNGFTFLLFRAITEGVPWKDGQAIVFLDYNDVVNNFTEFWNLLSYEAVKDGQLDAVFRLSRTNSRGYYRPIDQVIDSDATYGRNPFNAALKPFLDRFFGDIANQDAVDILKHCYVHSRPVQIIDKDLKLAIRDEIPKFAAMASQISLDEEADSGEVGTHIKQAVLGRSPIGDVVMIMGGIGSGKSTFCRRFFRVVAPELVQEAGQAMLVYLDFLGAPDHPEQLEAFLWETTSRSIQKAEPKLRTRTYLEQIFSEGIGLTREIFGTGANADDRVNNQIMQWVEQPKKYAESALRYCARTARLPIVVFDNVDQLRFEAQAQLFTAAQQFANAFGCLSILVLREESYSAALMKKHLTAYTIRPYHLSSPRFSKLLELRINCAVYDAVNRSRESEAGNEERVYGGIVTLFGLLRQSMFGKNKNIIRLVESIAYGNMRLALNLFNTFITSGATDVPKIIHAYSTSGGYSVPFHEFAKSVMLGDYQYYKESRSLVLNLFNVTRTPNASHFTTLRILKYLQERGGGNGRSEDFVRLQSLITDFVDFFNNEEDCKHTLLRLIAVDRQLVELDSRRPDTLEGATEVRITASGTYYLNFMVNSFQYSDLVWHDTPFSTRGISDFLTRLIHNADMHKRFERVEKFLEYLQQEESQELSDYGLTVQTPSFCGPFVPRIRQFYKDEKQVIKEKLRL